MDYRHGIQEVIYIVYTSIKLKFLIIDQNFCYHSIGDLTLIKSNCFYFDSFSFILLAFSSSLSI